MSVSKLFHATYKTMTLCSATQHRNKKQRTCRI